ncbi:hypothetical protein R1sor_012848 [Riccia sorocarpa]|uniref:Uncharacterized protein n=1 Tax=Riccia sorocarpa TaxID=122646 RepID=A0ABD3I8Y7_9MARC
MFNSVIEEAEARLDQGSEFKRYIQRIDPARYALYAMPLPRYGRSTSNVVECMNAALKLSEIMPLVELYAKCSCTCSTYFKSLALCYSKTIHVIMETELAMCISCRAPPPTIRTGRHRVVRIPNGGSTTGASTVEFEYPLTQEPRVISSCYE